MGGEGAGGGPGGFAAAGAKSKRDKTALSNPAFASGPDREQAARAKSLGRPGDAPQTPTVSSVGELVAAPVRASSLLSFTNLAVTVADELMNPGTSDITKGADILGGAVQSTVDSIVSGGSGSRAGGGGTGTDTLSEDDESVVGGTAAVGQATGVPATREDGGGNGVAARKTTPTTPAAGQAAAAAPSDPAVAAATAAASAAERRRRAQARSPVFSTQGDTFQTASKALLGF